MDLEVWPRGDGVPHHGDARWNGAFVPCALGRAGVRLDKREGDNATPIGVFRDVDTPQYDVELNRQIESARSKRGPGDLNALFSGGETWTVA